jgi:hypothetical protein
MPFCPKCRDEFQDWVKICPDCGVRLVDNLPPIVKARPVSDPLVTIAEFPGAAAAQIASGKLKGEGIWSFVTDGTSWTLVFGSFQLQVRQLDVKRARRILELSDE